jgi:hypothetical protein
VLYDYDLTCWCFAASGSGAAALQLLAGSIASDKKIAK